MLPKTRKITREINEVMFAWMNVWEVSKMQDWDVSTLPMSNIEKAGELAVKLMFGLSQEELDWLTDEDFALLSTEVNKKK